MQELKKILIVAGETSGDLHAAALVEAIKELYPRSRFFGLGGAKLKAQGVDVYYDLVSLAVVGIFEVLKNIKKFKFIFKGLLAKIDADKPDMAILVDYPGFNLRLAKELKKRGIPVIYYISPQVWAWGKGRIKTIRDTVQRIIVLFKFEEDLYEKENIPVTFVGHPLLNTVRANLNKVALFAKYDIPDTQYTVSLLPGSREKEIKNILPVMLQSATLLFKELASIKFLILKAPGISDGLIVNILSGYKLPVYILQDATYDTIAASDFALVCSGTATLETAILGTPMAIFYKISFLTWLYLKAAIRLDYIGMVNIIAGRAIVPEFIQYNTRPRLIADYIKGILTSPEESDRIRKLLMALRLRLGEEGASKKAARVIVELLKE